MARRRRKGDGYGLTEEVLEESPGAALHANGELQAGRGARRGEGRRPEAVDGSDERAVVRVGSGRQDPPRRRRHSLPPPLGAPLLASPCTPKRRDRGLIRVAFLRALLLPESLEAIGQRFELAGLRLRHHLRLRGLLRVRQRPRARPERVDTLGHRRRWEEGATEHVVPKFFPQDVCSARSRQGPSTLT